MPFERQTQKLLSEGINLLPPHDLIGKGEAEKCVNWLPDQLGKLRARQGTYELYPSLGDRLHTIMYVESTPAAGWWLGVDTSIYNWVATTAPIVNDVITGDPAVFDGDFLGWASFQGYLWIINRASQGRITGTDFWPWLPAAPEAAPAVVAGTGMLSGKVRYYYTYTTDKSYESNPSPASEWLTLTTAQGAFVTITWPDNPEVTGAKIYREGGLLPAPYQIYFGGSRGVLYTDETVVTEEGIVVRGSQAAGSTIDIEDQGGIEDDDTVSDEAYSIEAGVVLEDDHDPPPAAFGLAGPYFDRLLAFQSVEHPNRLWWTPSAQPWYFRGSASDDGDWVDIGEHGEPIYAVSVKPHICYIYKAHSIWRLVGDPDDGLLEQVTPHFGLRGPRAWASHGAVDYFKTNEGLYVMSGDRAVKFSEKVDPIFKGRWSGVVEATSPMSIDSEDEYVAAMAVVNDRLYFSYPEQD